MLLSLGRKLLFAVALAIVFSASLAVWPVDHASPEQRLARAGARLCYALDETLLIGALLEGDDFGDADADTALRIPSLQRLSLAGSRVSLAPLWNLKSVPRLWNLNLSRTQLSSDALRIVAQAPQLTELRLEGCDWLRDDDLRALEPLAGLQMLSLSGTPVSPACLPILEALPRLRFLHLDRCPKFDDASIDALISLCSSRSFSLNLSGTEITGDGLSRLRSALPHCLIQFRPETMVGLRDLAERGTFLTNERGEVRGFRPRVDSDGLIIPLEPGDLTIVGRIPTLVELNLERTLIGDTLLEELGDLPKLESLRLSETPITDQGLRILRRFPNLKTLWLQDTDLDGEGLVHLRHTPHLRHLRVSARDPARVVAALASLPELEQALIQSPLSDVDLRDMAACRHLKSLTLIETHIRGPGLEHLAALESLSELRLDGGLLDDSSVDRLSRLTSLRWIALFQTGVTSHGRGRIVARRPDLKLHWTSRDGESVGMTSGRF